MKRISRRIYRYTALFLTLLCNEAFGQRIIKVDVDSIACMNDTLIVGIGLSDSSDVQVRNFHSAISHSEVAFLPDGVECEPYGCSYRSTITFSDFSDTSRIRSVQDIDFVRINIEHSFIGDLYMSVVCPNGQSASLMNWSGQGQSECTGEVPIQYIGWTPGSNTATGAHFGDAWLGSSYINPCDPTDLQNTPGTGWDYCWSSRVDPSIQYAPGAGLIYNITNLAGTSIRASDAANRLNFYHPNESFSSLIGCPLNGDWYINVLDAWSGDNGYIFEWELALDPSLLADSGYMTGDTLIGGQTEKINDSIFVVYPPQSTANDTIIEYTARIYSSNNIIIDTIFHIHYYKRFETIVDTSVCYGDSIVLENIVYRSDTSFTHSYLSLHSCDSIVNYTFRFLQHLETTDTTIYCTSNPLADYTTTDTLTASFGCDSIAHHQFLYRLKYELEDTIFFCNDAPFVYDGVDYGGPTTLHFNHHTVDGCDSIIHLSLAQAKGGSDHRLEISSDGREWSSDTVLLGCVPFSLKMRDTTQWERQTIWIPQEGDSIFGGQEQSFTYTDTGIYSPTLILAGLNGCNDTLRLDSAVYVFPTPHAAFDWLPVYPVVHFPQVHFRNHSRPLPGDVDSLRYRWWISTGVGGGGEDSLFNYEPSYNWGDPLEVQPGLYPVRLGAYWTHQGPDSLFATCADTAVAAVEIINDWLEFPSLVTPNGDGTNDRWEVVNLVECMQYPVNELWIYNEWGSLVFHAKNIRTHEEFWDPNLTSSPDGSYFFRFSARSEYGIVKRNGAIEVVRGQ